MPLESEAQRRYLWATDPELAKKFEDETPKGTKLPARKKKSETAVDDTVELKNFSDKEREKLAKKGDAMPGGGFPIRNGNDLRNAIQAVGRAKDPAAAKAFIIKRAKELKLTDVLPAGWTGSTKEEMTARVEALELAVLALGAEEFGDSPGHPFRGNQWTTSQGGNGDENDEYKQDEKDARALYDRSIKSGLTHSEAIDEVYNSHGEYIGAKLDQEKNGLSDKNFSPGRGFGGLPNDIKDAPTPKEGFLGSARGEKADAVNLRNFDANGRANGLPLFEELKTGSPVSFNRAMGYEKPGNQFGTWVMQHEASGTRVSGMGKRTEVEAGIKEQYPKSGSWTYLP